MNQEAYIALIITEIGGDTVDALLATNLPTYWAAHADLTSDAAKKAAVKVDAIRLLIGQSWKKVSFKALDGASVNLSDMFEHLLKLLELAQQELAQSTAGGVGAGAAIGTLTKTAPVMGSPRCGPDPNDRALRGDPLRRTRGRLP